MRLIQGDTRGIPDVEAFLSVLSDLRQHPLPEVRGLFQSSEEIIVARAPGRLDLMGGIADYSGSLVLQMPIREAALVAVQKRTDRAIRIVSVDSSRKSPHARTFTMQMEHLERSGRPVEYDEARKLFSRNPDDHWVAYVAGAFVVLMRELGVSFRNGFDVLIESHVPEGKGVSSSAALEVAVMFAILGTIRLEISSREVALLCQKVENLVVGAPCGIMDQMASACGEQGKLLALLCQPAELQEPVAIPAEIQLAGFDSGVRHAVTGDPYGDARAGAFMGYRILADEAGLPVRQTGNGEPLSVQDPQWRGYLANVGVQEFENRFAPRIPAKIKGEEFLSRYEGTTDPLTRVIPSKQYAVRTPTAHPIYEHERVAAFRNLLPQPVTISNLKSLGERMFHSHESYSACGLGCRETDILVGLSKKYGPSRGIFGAKITGGGSGGTVVMLGKFGAEVREELAAEYTRATGHVSYIFSGSSPGAAEFGTLRLSPEL